MTDVHENRVVQQVLTVNAFSMTWPPTPSPQPTEVSWSREGQGVAACVAATVRQGHLAPLLDGLGAPF